MKKLVSLFLGVLMVLFIGTAQVEADGAITAEEQQIITALSQGVTVGGKTFTIPGDQLAQAENYLKQNALTSSEINAVLSQINGAMSLISSQNIDMSKVNSLADLVKALPADVINQVKNYVSSAASTLGLAVSSWNGGNIVLTSTGGNTDSGSSSTASNNAAAGGNRPVYSSAKPVKQTGANYTASFVALAAILVVAGGSLFVVKKTAHA